MKAIPFLASIIASYVVILPVSANCADFLGDRGIINGTAQSDQGESFKQTLYIFDNDQTGEICNPGETCFTGWMTLVNEKVTDQIFGRYDGHVMILERRCSTCDVPGYQVYEGLCVGDQVRGRYLDGNGDVLAGRFRWR